MRLLAFGATGQVGRELVRAAEARGHRLEALGREAADLADPEACAARIADTDAEAVINAAAHTAVDRAESEPDLAHAINAAAPGAMARAAAARALPFLHVSTDYVFDGRPGPVWTEEDAPAPVSVYGASKLAGEAAVTAAGGAHVILRTAWVFSAHGSNFVKTMLRVGPGRESLQVVDDQRGGPTPARAIAEALLTVAEAFRSGNGTPGLFHFSGTPPVSWAEFAEAIFAEAGGPAPRIARIPSSAWPVPAQRPANSVLDCRRIAAAYGIAQPDWRDALPEVITELRETT